MTIIDDRTANLNLALPNKDNALEDDVARLRSALTGIDTAWPGKADLVAGKVPAGQLPSYVDDVVEVANFASLPTTGEAGKIYVTLDNNKTFRWGGSAYAEISASPGTTDALAEGATNKYFTDARAIAAIPHADASTFGTVKIGAGLGIDGGGALYASAGGGSAMTIQEIIPASNGLSSVPVPGGYVVGAVLVGLNGSWLAPSDYTATDGSNIGFVGMTVGTADSVVLAKLATVSIMSLPAGSVGTAQLADGCVTVAKTTGVAASGANSDITSLSSPSIGSATAVTQATGDSSTKVATTAFTNPASALSSSGYQKLPSGLIIQWGTFTSSASADVAVTFPIAFPNAARQIVVSAGAVGTGVWAAYNTLAAGGFNGNAWTSGGRFGQTCSYVAIGN